MFKTGLGIDIGALIVGAVALMGFTSSYGAWSAYRGFSLGEDCLRALDADCVRKEVDMALGPNGTQQTIRKNSAYGRWIWALRFATTPGTMEERVSKLISGESELKTEAEIRDLERSWGRPLPHLREPPESKLTFAEQVRTLANVSNIMDALGQVDGAGRYRKTVADMQSERSLTKVGVRRVREDNRYGGNKYWPSGGVPLSFRCSNPEEAAEARGNDLYGENTFDLSVQHPCYLPYFATRSDEELLEFIELNLEEMNSKLLSHGEAGHDDLIGMDRADDERPAGEFNQNDYIERIAWLATIIAYKENGGSWGTPVR